VKSGRKKGWGSGLGLGLENWEWLPWVAENKGPENSPTKASCTLVFFAKAINFLKLFAICT